MQWARLLGALGSLVVGGKSIYELKASGYSTGRAVILTVTGYDKTAPADEGILPKLERAAERSWWPILTGELIHQVYGNPEGAWKSGMGMKLNSMTPKGMNF